MSESGQGRWFAAQMSAIKLTMAGIVLRNGGANFIHRQYIYSIYVVRTYVLGQ